MSGPSPSEWEEVAQRFGVESTQVRRDHLISHVLAAIAAGVHPDDVVFFGGTALSRTHLTQGRLSEDIDLIATAARSQVAAQVEAAVRRGLARSHGRPSWRPALTATRNSDPAVLSVPDGTSIQVQLLSDVGYPPWPTEITEIEQRYGDAPPARLRVLTADGFVAAKLSAWLHRATPRDLYDLAAMAAHGLIGASAAATFARHGPTGKPLPASTFDQPVDEGAWRRALGHQTHLRTTAHDALATFRDAWLTAQAEHHGRP